MTQVPPAASSIVDAIGQTPAVWLDRLTAGLPGRILLKLESLNPGGSIKDRAALQCLRDAEADGRLRPGMPVVELTSGNMGIGLAVACAVMGYRMIAVMSEGNSPERRQLLQAYGAEIELVPQAAGGVAGKVSGEDLALVEQRTVELVAGSGRMAPGPVQQPVEPPCARIGHRAGDLGAGRRASRRVCRHRRHRGHVHRHLARAEGARSRHPMSGRRAGAGADVGRAAGDQPGAQVAGRGLRHDPAAVGRTSLRRNHCHRR